MALMNYGVLRGRVIDGRREDESNSPHYQVEMTAGETCYRIAVNVKSQAEPSELLFLVDENFQHPILAGLNNLPIDFTSLPNQPGNGALDYIRGNLFSREDLRSLPHNLPGQDNDLNDRMEHYFNRAKQDPGAEVWAFGQRWGPVDAPDPTFQFQPGNGVHDIHMNQGNSLDFARDDGPWQDGGIIFHFPEPEQWVAVFLAFQSQAWHTDDLTGHALTPAAPGGTDNIVHIVGAMVNPAGPAPEKESIILLNTSPDPIDLTGWAVADKLKNKQPLSGTIEAGSTLSIALQQPVQLSNKGGIITLLDKDGLKVDGVSYTAEQAAREGWVIAF